MVVYQMGKVGSQAVARSLERTLGKPVFHVHFLTPEGIAWAERVYRGAWDPARNPDHLWDAQHLRRRLDLDRRSEPWRVVSLVRDPVARNLSSFFQVAGLQFGVDLERLGAVGGAEAVTTLTTLFLERFDEHDVPARWFDDELGAVFGIDVFAAPFPERGWSQHTAARADVVVVKLERLAEVGDDAFRALLGAPYVEVPDVNVGSDKGYGELYRRFVAAVRLPPAYLDRVYGTRFARHFYTDEERARLTDRWLRGRGATDDLFGAG